MRSRVYKRTRPKILNGKTLNGEMLLELCLAYTDAINTGSVPNIQSAWSYVCQNEHQRLLQSCLSRFEKDIQDPLKRAKQEYKISILKNSYSDIREECVLNFRKDAMVGGDSATGIDAVQMIEVKLRSQIKEKYRNIKLDFVKHC